MIPETIERDAKLFEAGSYPDRGIEISEDDLDAIISNTREAPIRIEHSNTPFDGALGVLKSVYRKGKELFGKLCFTKAAWELINSANAKRLSVAIKKDKSGIAEVSLVREPRIADAAVFSDGISVILGEVDLSLNEEFAASPDTEVSRLRQELAEKDAQSKIDELKRSGKLAPAAEEFAKAMLMAADSSVITFADEEMPVSKVFLQFIEAQPKVIEFSELATVEGADDCDEPEIFAKLGITSKQVDRYRTR